MGDIALALQAFEDSCMFYVALALIAVTVGALCYSIEVLNREGVGMLQD